MRRLVVLLWIVALVLALDPHAVMAHPHEGADWDSIAVQARALGSMPDAAAHRVAESSDGFAAQASSIVCTLVPVAAGLLMQNEAGGALFVSGVWVGPSVGYFVGGHPVRGLQGALGRAGLTALGAGMVGIGLVQGLEYGNDDAASIAVVAGGIVGLGVLGSAVYDMVTVHATVDRHAREAARVRVQGMRAPASGAPALAVRLAF